MQRKTEPTFLELLDSLKVIAAIFSATFTQISEYDV